MANMMADVRPPRDKAEIHVIQQAAKAFIIVIMWQFI